MTEASRRTLRVLSIATRFPDVARPNLGLFVEQSLAGAARQPGIDLTVAAPLGVPPWPVSLHKKYRELNEIEAEENWRGLELRRPRYAVLPGRDRDPSPTSIANAVIHIARELRPDVIDAQFLFPDGPAAMRVSQSLGIPYSVKARGFDVAHWMQRPKSAEQIRETLTGASGLLVASHTLKAEMEGLELPGADTATVHYPAVDTDRFRPRDRDRAKAALGLAGPVLLSVGELEPGKNQALIIEALTKLPDTTLLLAGEGASLAAYQALAEHLLVADRIRFLGSVPQAALAALYAAADIVVMPSESEGLANAWVEALACGTPVLIGDAGGASELLTRPEGGRIVARTAQAIREGVAEILANPPAQDAVAATLGDRFDADANGAALADHWRTIAFS